MDYDKIIEEITGLDGRELLELAEKTHNDNYGKTEIYYNYETKECEAFCITTNTRIVKENLVFLFEIRQNSYANCNLSETEFWEESYQDIDDFFDVEKVIDELKEEKRQKEQGELAEKEWEKMRQEQLAEMQKKIQG